MIDLLIAGFILVILISPLYFLISLQQEVKKQNNKSNYSKANTKNTTSKKNKASKIGHLESQLLNMVGGEKDVAKRLVNNIKLKNPDRDEKWCWEKAIQDLERDRRW